jgi:type IV pilus assembly protein PilW
MANRRGGAGACRGVSLVETMVAMAIGLLVSGAAMAALLASGFAGRHAGALAQMTENAATAAALIREHLSLAGFGQPTARDGQGRLVRTIAGRAVFGCDGGFDNPKAAFDALSCAGTQAADAIAIVHEADTRNALASGSGLPLDCLGNGIAASQAGAGQPAIHRADSRFFVGSVVGSARKELYCKGAGAAAAQPLVEGIEDLQISYALASSAEPGALVTWRRAAEIAAPEWVNVVGVKFCVLATSADPVGDRLTVYTDCQGRRITAADRRLYRAFTTTVVLYNRLAETS